MNARMMAMPLTIASIIRHADRWHGDTELVSRRIEGGVHRCTYQDAHRRSRQLAKARRAIRAEVEQRLKTNQSFSPAEIDECFECVVDDAGNLDLGDWLDPGRKKSAADRSMNGNPS